ncbi:MAG: protein kinase [Zoogloeaceae bacterium]|jgi:tRNA A-37 threonylcarbamoyl transferase component Bud32|nr:protein kinase [Zoogloeaceae bacterium]
MMPRWNLNPDYAQLAADFGSLEAVFALRGEKLTSDPRSEVIRVERAGVRYYVKRYGAGVRRVKNWRLHWRRYLRHFLLDFLPRPRVKAEWQNLEKFAKWNIPVPEIVAWGMERRCGAFYRGALITRELVGAEDLARLASQGDPRFSDAKWVQRVSRQIAAHTRTLHENRFIHNDLKWRNILVDQSDKVWFIDCPLGMRWFGVMLAHRQIKDLACLDKLARRYLTASQRLRFYRFYRRYPAKRRLDAADKQRIRAIVHFFKEEA